MVVSKAVEDDAAPIVPRLVGEARMQADGNMNKQEGQRNRDVGRVRSQRHSTATVVHK